MGQNKKNYMIMSLDAEKSFDKKHLCMIKTQYTRNRKEIPQLDEEY